MITAAALDPPEPFQAFYDNLDSFAETPEGVAKLRALVLDLAVRGELVDQDENDEPARILLETSLAGKTNNSKTTNASFSSEPPFIIPSSWEWARFEQIVDFDMGKTPSTKAPKYWGEQAIPWVSIADMPATGLISETKKTVTQEAVEEVFKRPPVPKGTLLMSFKLSIGKVAFLEMDAYHNEAIISIAPPIPELSQYLHVCLRAIDLLSGSAAAIKGRTLNKSSIREIAIPLPPLSEQRRIVSKVDGLMSLCDELESRGTERVRLREHASHSCLERLVSSTSRRDLASAWQRLNDHFEVLYDTPETLAHLRQSILQLAVQGKLVPQDDNDEPADVLLEQIASETRQLVKDKKLRKPKPLAPIEPHELPFVLPSGWKWTQAQDACNASSLITYGILKPVWVTNGVPTVRVKDMKNGQIVTNNVAHCSPERADKFSKTSLTEGDLLIAKDGATLGKTAFVPSSLDGGNITQHVLRFPISKHLARLYIRLVVDAPHGQAWMRGETKGVALPGVNVGDFRRMSIPLPPLAEQKRIVAKVDQLLSQCDELSARLRERQSTSEQLLTATIHRLLENVN